jgi:hypothetical protein
MSLVLRTGTFSDSENDYLESKFKISPAFKFEDYDEFRKKLNRSRKSVINWFKRRRFAERNPKKKEKEVN